LVSHFVVAIADCLVAETPQLTFRITAADGDSGILHDRHPTHDNG